ncbi:MAG: GAF domain-containing protein, partial [Gammaproteobacteria bacterium]
GIVRWVYDMGQTAGLGTDTLPFSDAIYVPLLTSHGSVGVLKVHPLDPQHLLTPEQMQLLESCANQIALALEVDRLQEQAKKAELQAETSRVRDKMLETVSHDLDAPLSTLLKVANSLMTMGNRLDALKIEELAKGIYSELDEVNRLIQKQPKD